MPIIDLATPWAAAARAADPAELDGFLARSHGLLEPIRRQRAPTETDLPPPADWTRLPELAADGGLHQALRETRDRLIDHGLVAPRSIVLLASAAPGGPAEVIPQPGGETVALFVDRALDDPQRLVSVLGGAMATLTRWTVDGNPIARLAATGAWDRWAAARAVPLAEWIYTAGLEAHGALLVAGTAAAALRLSEGELRRMRSAERSLQARLQGELNHAGIGLVMRWLEDGGPVAMHRAADGAILPRGAGRYLGWRMLAERVERVGLAEAARM